jgi:hypothetical protein
MLCIVQLKHLGAHLTEKEFVHLTKIVDHDSSGEITFSELNKFVTGEAPGNTTDKVNEQNPQQRYSMVSTRYVVIVFKFTVLLLTVCKYTGFFYYTV